jgi:hypothetical protein
VRRQPRHLVALEPADEVPARRNARGLEHLHLGWALAGWTMRLPVIRPFVQLLADALGAGPQPVCRRAVMDSPLEQGGQCSQAPRGSTLRPAAGGAVAIQRDEVTHGVRTGSRDRHSDPVRGI